MNSTNFDPIAYINKEHWQESRLGLTRIRVLLERLGRPQDRLRFIHVAGTNGKGSTCAYVASILQNAGFRTGLFTSPFIEHFEERLRVNGTSIGLDELRAITLTVRDKAEALARETGEHATEFELMTAVAFLHFAQKACDVVVLEVGLGGRLDSTNVIGPPEVAVIARIGLDHTNILGSTIQAITEEKAGIIKAGTVVVSCEQEPLSMQVIERVSRKKQTPLAVVDFQQIQVSPVRRRAMGEDKILRPFVRAFSYRGNSYETQLLGIYQPENASLALEVIQALRSRGWYISEEAQRRGIAATRWPGRFEVMGCSASHSLVVMDGGHNPQGARALVQTLADIFSGQKPVFIMGVLADKDYLSMIKAVVPIARGFVCIAPQNPRSLSAHKLAESVHLEAKRLFDVNVEVSVQVAESMAEALQKARELAEPDGLICSFGSLYSIAPLKAALRNETV